MFADEHPLTQLRLIRRLKFLRTKMSYISEEELEERARRAWEKLPELEKEYCRDHRTMSLSNLPESIISQLEPGYIEKIKEMRRNPPENGPRPGRGKKKKKAENQQDDKVEEKPARVIKKRKKYRPRKKKIEILLNGKVLIPEIIEVNPQEGEKPGSTLQTESGDVKPCSPEDESPQIFYGPKPRGVGRPRKYPLPEGYYGLAKNTKMNYPKRPVDKDKPKVEKRKRVIRLKNNLERERIETEFAELPPIEYENFGPCYPGADGIFLNCDASGNLKIPDRMLGFESSREGADSSQNQEYQGRRSNNEDSSCSRYRLPLCSFDGADINLEPEEYYIDHIPGYEIEESNTSTGISPNKDEPAENKEMNENPPDDISSVINDSSILSIELNTISQDDSCKPDEAPPVRKKRIIISASAPPEEFQKFNPALNKGSTSARSLAQSNVSVTTVKSSGPSGSANVVETQQSSNPPRNILGNRRKRKNYCRLKSSKSKQRNLQNKKVQNELSIRLYFDAENIEQQDELESRVRDESEISSSNLLEILDPDANDSNAEYTYNLDFDKIVDYSQPNHEYFNEIQDDIDDMPSEMFEVEETQALKTDQVKDLMVYSRIDSEFIRKLYSFEVDTSQLPRLLRKRGTTLWKFIHQFVITTLTSHDEYLNYFDAMVLYSRFRQYMNAKDKEFFYRLYIYELRRKYKIV